MNFRLAFMLLLAASVGAGPPVAAARIIVADGVWAAIDRGAECEARGRSVREALNGAEQATAGFAFRRDRGRWGEFRIRLSRVPRRGSSVMATIGGQPFLLVAGGGWAWSRGPAQDTAIIAAVRASTGMKISARDDAGRRIDDLYALDGAPTAIDAAAARCAAPAGGTI